MKKLLGLTLAATFAVYTVAPVETNGESKKKPLAIPEYTLELVDADMWGILDISNKGDVLIERQLVQSADPVPLIIKKNSKETAAFECPGTTNDTLAEGFNNHGDIVGHCGHQPGFTVAAFIANPKSGSVSLFAYPGAISTWAFGINDLIRL